MEGKEKLGECNELGRRIQAKVWLRDGKRKDNKKICRIIWIGQQAV